jgi:ERCC4-type nuclease
MLRIVQSDQERKPWIFPPGFASVDVRHLRTGDYTVEGFEESLTIERKSLGDFVSTVIHDAIRFRKELRRMAAMSVACIVVEANLDQLLAHEYQSEANPKSVLGRAHSFLIDYGIPVLWWGPPEQCATAALQFLELATRKLS